MKRAAMLIALLLATSAHADGERTLHLAVHGSIDGAVLGAAISKELGVDVAVVDGACALPCLDVMVGGSDGDAAAVTVVFAPRQGAPRQRDIALGSDPAQWPTVITLLAGNVVRDEAQDVLAGLPSDLPSSPAPDAAPSDVPAEPELGAPPPLVVPPPPLVLPPPLVDADEPREHRWLGLGLVPGLSTDLTHIGSVGHFLSIDLLVGVSGGSSGLSLAGIADIERGPVSGFQVGGVVAIARNLDAGFQVGGVATVARRVAGTQVAGVAAGAGDVTGVQVAGTAAVADRIDGVQVGGVAAVSRSRASTQVGGIAAVANGDSNVQAGGIAAVASGTVNVQIAGIVDVARRVSGLQLAPINVAGRVDGVQIGVINVGSADGFSFGLINIVPGGRVDLETAIDSHRTGTILFRHGGRRWHNVYGIGGHPVNESGPNDDVWMYGLGFGPSYSFGHTVVDVELIGWQVNHGPHHETDLSILGQARLSIAHQLGPIALVAGGVFNAYVTDDGQSPLVLERRVGNPPGAMSNNVTVTTWPSAFVGVRL